MLQVFLTIASVNLYQKELWVTLIDLPCVTLSYLMPQLILTTNLFVISLLMSFESQQPELQTPRSLCSSTFRALSLSAVELGEKAKKIGFVFSGGVENYGHHAFVSIVHTGYFTKLNKLPKLLRVFV